MEQEYVAERCSAMSVKELLRATTVDAADYEDAFHVAAQRELSRRGLEVHRVRDQARLLFPDGSVHEIQVDAIMEMLPRQLPEGATLGVENCIDELLTFERHGAEWLVHHTAQGIYKGSWICPTDDAMHAAAGRFVRLEDWDRGLDRDVPVSDWVVIEPSCSMGFVRRAMEAMESKGIHARAVPDPSGATCRGTCVGAPTYAVLVKQADEERARSILDGFSGIVERLHARAELCAERGEAEGELAAYEEILTLAPGDQVALFNRGSLLMEARRYDEAFDCFTPLMGHVDDHTLNDIREYLKEILEASPSIPLLHTLAEIERGRGGTDSARSHLETALQMDDGHALTHLALGYLLYEDTEYDTTAAIHFTRYLELVPEADDREAIEMILDELDARH